MVLVAVVGLWATLRLQSQKLGVCTLALLGALTWLFTWLPLERPYGLQVGSPSSFELALVTGGSVTDTPFEGWVEGWRNPRPAWSLLWSFLSPGRPDQARRMYELVPLLTLVLLPVAVYMLFRSRTRDGTWEALTCAFAAVFASSVPLDAFQPFGMFCRSFFRFPPPCRRSPHRAGRFGTCLEWARVAQVRGRGGTGDCRMARLGASLRGEP